MRDDKHSAYSVHEIDPTFVELDEEPLGSGNFGCIYRGRLKSDHRTEKYTLVAVKMLKTQMADKETYSVILQQLKEAISEEIQIMSRIGYHENVLKLIGSMKHGDLLCLVSEYCPFGSLDKFLSSKKGDFVDEIAQYSGKKGRTVYKSELDENWASLYQQRRAGNIVTTSDLLSFAYQIANGMEFLHSKEVVHRDLALRNILLTFHYIVKIGDFGLSRQTISGSYQKCHNPLLPVKWTAPEVFVHNTIPIESDLYTFGILLWELFTLGGTPHEQFIFIQEVEEKEQNVVVKKGKRMNKPSFAPREIYELIKVLCNFDPYLRPPLKQCKRKIVTSLKEACPLLAVHLDVADASEKSDKTNQSHEASSMKIPQRKGEFLPQSLANDDNNIPIPKEKQSSCITQKYRRNIILISAVVFFTFAAISVAIVFLSKRSNSAGTQNNNNFNVTSTVISTDGSTSAASETSASINTVTTSLLITSVNQQKSEPTSAKSPTTPKPTTTSTVPQNSQSPANSTCRNLDLLFLIDESQSMHISDGFWAAKSFILNVTDTYDFFPNSRFAWIIFNSKLWMLTPFMNAQDFKDNVTNTDFNEGSTNFVLGFNATNYTISIYSGPSKQRQPVVIFVSDGNPNDGGSLNQVIAYTAYLRCNLNTLIIGLGVSETLTDAQTMKDAIGVGAQDGCIASHYGDISNYAQIPVAGLPQVEQDLQCRPTKSE